MASEEAVELCAAETRWVDSPNFGPTIDPDVPLLFSLAPPPTSVAWTSNSTSNGLNNTHRKLLACSNVLDDVAIDYVAR